MLLLTALAFALPDVDSPVRASAPRPADAAVVIGIEDYAFLQDVPFAERDAWAIAETLTLSVGLHRARVQVLAETPSREQILRAVQEASASAEPGGTVWVYFAGHGAADPASGQRMLLGVDAQADRDTFAARSVRLDDLSAAASSSGTDVFLILDTCFVGRGREGSDLVPGARMVVPMALTRQSGVTEWTATEPSQWASPLPEARHGAFTYAALGAMRGWADGFLDGTADGSVSTDEADAYVRHALRDLGVRNQVPAFSGTSRVLVQGGRLEPAPDLALAVRVTYPPAVQRGPKRRSPALVLTGVSLAGVGLTAAIASFAAGAGSPDTRPEALSTLKVVNGVGWGVAGVGATVGAIGAIVPVRQGAAVQLSGKF